MAGGIYVGSSVPPPVSSGTVIAGGVAQGLNNAFQTYLQTQNMIADRKFKNLYLALAADKQGLLIDPNTGTVTKSAREQARESAEDIRSGLIAPDTGTGQGLLKTKSQLLSPSDTTNTEDTAAGTGANTPEGPIQGARDASSDQNDQGSTTSSGTAPDMEASVPKSKGIPPLSQMAYPNLGMNYSPVTEAIQAAEAQPTQAPSPTTSLAPGQGLLQRSPQQTAQTAPAQPQGMINLPGGYKLNMGPQQQKASTEAGLINDVAGHQAIDPNTPLNAMPDTPYIDNYFKSLTEQRKMQKEGGQNIISNINDIPKALKENESYVIYQKKENDAQELIDQIQAGKTNPASRAVVDGLVSKIALEANRVPSEMAKDVKTYNSLGNRMGQYIKDWTSGTLTNKSAKELTDLAQEMKDFSHNKVLDMQDQETKAKTSILNQYGKGQKVDPDDISHSLYGRGIGEGRVAKKKPAAEGQGLLSRPAPQSKPQTVIQGGYTYTLGPDGNYH